MKINSKLLIFLKDYFKYLMIVLNDYYEKKLNH